MRPGTFMPLNHGAKGYNDCLYEFLNRSLNWFVQTQWFIQEWHMQVIESFTPLIQKHKFIQERNCLDHCNISEAYVDCCVARLHHPIEKKQCLKNAIYSVLNIVYVCVYCNLVFYNAHTHTQTQTSWLLYCFPGAVEVCCYGNLSGVELNC